MNQWYRSGSGTKSPPTVLKMGYVELGLGVGIVAAMAYNPVRDAGLRLLEAPGLFEINTTCLALRRGQYLRDYALRFIMDCAPDLTAAGIKEALFPKDGVV